MRYQQTACVGSSGTTNPSQDVHGKGPLGTTVIAITSIGVKWLATLTSTTSPCVSANRHEVKAASTISSLKQTGQLEEEKATATDNCRWLGGKHSPCRLKLPPIDLHINCQTSTALL
ncbi:hypothetical protein Bpfe_020445 [Biomphalaria pfeifferi]|uniref:Uncharacterized protein n=1 Tax=Biomphalaria pfeifferi TaxID=112525 RepID=A0AAD8B9Z6_BIOPF|nr:hypothetical protein Bpfe_020445 [Biomphalaria pfeifferi]